MILSRIATVLGALILAVVGASPAAAQLTERPAPPVDTQRVPTEPGSIRLSWEVWDQAYNSNTSLWTTRSSAQVVLAGWIPKGDISIDWAWYREGSYEGADDDTCYSTGYCTRNSRVNDVQHIKGTDKFCIRVTVTSKTKRLIATDKSSICRGPIVGV